MVTLLRKTILSTADIGRLFNVTETTVKRWADEGTLKCQKTPGGHRKFEMKDVVEFAEKNHFEPVCALEMPENDTLSRRIQGAVLEKDFQTLVDVYVDKILSSGETALFPFLSYLYQHRLQLWEIHDHIIRPAMAELGRRWAEGEIGVNHEHCASYETLDALAKLQGQIRIKPPTGRSAVCACLGSEMHEIGLRCATYLVESEGWQTHYLGARIPSSAVCSAIGQFKPALVCLSATSYPDQTESLLGDLEAISGSARRCGSRVVLGGVSSRHLVAAESSVDAFPQSSKDLLDYISEFARENPVAQGRDLLE